MIGMKTVLFQKNKKIRFPTENKHLIIENKYFSNAERHLGNAERILALQNWHFWNVNQHLIIENQYFSNPVFKGTWISWFLTEQTFQSCFKKTQIFNFIVKWTKIGQKYTVRRLLPDLKAPAINCQGGLGVRPLL
jgi:hypothetical protein